MKILIIFSLALTLISCGKSSHHGHSGGISVTKPAVNADIAELFVYPSAGQMEYNGELLADLASNGAIVTSYGSVQRGTVLNVLTVKTREVLVYGEDGVFATECETHPDYPDHGPSHPLCEVFGAESFNRIIVCLAVDKSTPILTAQNWPGVVPAMTDLTIGMECWVDGVKMKSKRVFTY